MTVEDWPLLSQPEPRLSGLELASSAQKKLVRHSSFPARLSLIPPPTGAPRALQNEVLATDHNGTMRTLIYSVRPSCLAFLLGTNERSNEQGRPMRVKRTGEVAEWEDNRFADIKKLTSQGIVPVPFIGEVDVEGPKIMGQVRWSPCDGDGSGADGGSRSLRWCTRSFLPRSLSKRWSRALSSS